MSAVIASQQNREIALSCPVPIADYPNILLAHGGGGTLMHKLLEKMILPAFSNDLAESRHDGATFIVPSDFPQTRLALTTDSHVVHPLFFPGGDIGTLAVNGTVNDLAMCGATPLYLSVGFILEEGLPMESLWRIVQSMRRAADEAGVKLVTGDTKVVEKGHADGIFINTAGVGVIRHDLHIGPKSVRPGDAIIVSGDLGRHGIAIMALREGLQFSSDVTSDCAPLSEPVLAMLRAEIDVHCLRDLTRGGLASALNEIADASGLHLAIEEQAIQVSEEVRGACELLGLDPLHVANEGRFVAFVPCAQVERALTLLRTFDISAGAALVGTVSEEPSGLVTMKSLIGASRIVDMLSGEQLPRIC